MYHLYENSSPTPYARVYFMLTSCMSGKDDDNKLEARKLKAYFQNQKNEELFLVSSVLLENE